MFKFFRQYWPYLGAENQRRFYLMLFLSVLVSFAELLGLGMVLPFIAVLTNPEALLGMAQLQPVLGALNISSKQQLLQWVASSFILALLLSAALRIGHLWLKNQFGARVASRIASLSFQALLARSLAEQVADNSSHAIALVANKTTKVSVLAQAIVTVFSTAILSTAIVTGLLLVDPLVALVSGGALASGYFLTRKLASARLRRNAKQIALLQSRTVQSLQEALGGVRDVILDNSHKHYQQLFNSLDRPQKVLGAQNAFLAGIPRYVVETLAVMVVSLLAYYLQSVPGENAFLLPKLGALALGAQRMLPAMQQTYSAWAGVAGSSKQLSDVLAALQATATVELSPRLDQSPPISLKQKIQYQNVYYRYDKQQADALKGLSFTISKGERIGIIGTTGSGKSTCVDLLMGLLLPTDGTVMVDGLALTKHNVTAWYPNIAHQPQSIFLADTSVAENIALAVPLADIDMVKVEWAARQAQLHSHIESLPQGYLTRVGESGAWLSGGQRQRLGLARALYKQAAVLVLDEATSALDTATEAAVVKTIESLGQDLTIVAIAHRVSTLGFCDRILTMEAGQIVAINTPAELGIVS